MANYIQGSIEFIPLRVTESVDGASPENVNPASIGVSLSSYGQIPTDFQPVTVLDDKPGYLLSGNEALGSYQLWVKITENPEEVLRIAGSVSIISGV